MGRSRGAARPLFAPLKNVRKSDEVFAQLEALIRAGRFPPGTRLASERELAAKFNASRQTIREALYRAELVGIIEVRHGAGSFVVAARARGPLDASLAELIATEAGRIHEFLEIRRLIEGWCVRQAARCATPTDLRELRRILARMRQLDLDDPEWEANDVAFHVAIAGTTGNPLAVRIMEMLRESFGAFYRLKRVIPNKEEKALVWKLHSNVYDAIRKRDAERAYLSVVEHMDFIARKFRESVEDGGFSGK